MKLGFLVPSLGPSQLSFRVIYQSNKAIRSNKGHDIITFYEVLSQPCFSLGFATMNVIDAWNYHGPLIATTISSAEKIVRFPRPKQRYFYIWDLEWVHIKSRNFLPFCDIYQNPQLSLICRSESHKKIVEQCWNVKVRAVVEDFDIEGFSKIIEEDDDTKRSSLL